MWTLQRTRHSILGSAGLAFAATALAAGLVGSSAASAARLGGPSFTSAARSPAVTAPMRQYLGIPYASPPVGALRWKPPVPILGIPSKLQGVKFANHCPQPGGAFGESSTSEDCLYLNVFTPPNLPKDARLPVMVWIHGGAFTTGESDDYNPDRFVARGTVVVTLNYRLGLLGFFAHPALDKTAPAVNYGLLDQQAAIRWVDRNIASFGGDPKRIMIFGESAGGLSVFSQLASPGAAGLFSAALIESGAYQLALPTLAQSEAAGVATATALGCSSQTAACLRAVPVSTLVATETPMTVPTVDGTVLPLSPGTAFAAGKFNHVPVVDGSNHDEYRLFVAADFDLAGAPITAAEYPLLISASLGPTLGAEVVAQYPLSKYPSPDLAFATLVTDYIFACPALGADLALSQFVPVYTYEFADPNAPEPYLPPVSFPYGAAHASEIQFIWDSFTKPYPRLTSQEFHLGNDMDSYWAEFARTHQPNVFGSLPVWYPFVPGADNVQELVPPNPGLSFAFAGDHKCAFWASLAASAAATHSLDSIRAASLRFRQLR